MIHRRYDQGERLDVAGLNEITVLIDRSRTARTEVGLNSWEAGRDGPPHRHEAKEQIFFVLDGSSKVTVDGETRPVTVGDVVFVPWKAPHTTEAGAAGLLIYLCLNSIVTQEREASFQAMYARVAAGRIAAGKAEVRTWGNRWGMGKGNNLSGYPFWNEMGGWDGFARQAPQACRPIGGMRYRKDGWVAIRPVDRQGELVTKVLLAGANLAINARTPPDGHVRVEVLDAEGRPLPDFSDSNASSFTGDAVMARLLWKNGAQATLPRQPVRLRIRLDRADLFALHWR